MARFWFAFVTIIVVVCASGVPTVFRTWAPHAASVSAVGNVWSVLLQMTSPGVFEGSSSLPQQGDAYFLLLNESLRRIDPRARARSGNESAVWAAPMVSPGRFQRNQRVVLYEMHVPSFSPEGTLDGAAALLPRVAALGVTYVELMPVADFTGDPLGWGYSPSGAIGAVMQQFGGPDALVRFVKVAHSLGLGVVLDVVINHFAPDNLLLQFDGYAGSSGNGIFFFQSADEAETEWGPRPDFGQQEVADWLVETLAGFVRDFGVDGFRFDATVCVRKTGSVCWARNATDSASGIALLRRINAEFVDQLRIAEDDQGWPGVTAPVSEGGLNFSAQWAYQDFYYGFVLNQLIVADNSAINASAIASLVAFSTEGERVVFTENHDTASSQNLGRIPAVVDPGGNAHQPSYWAAKKAMMGLFVAAVTSKRGMMLLQGQEMLTYDTFVFPVPPKLDWSLWESNKGIVAETTAIIGLHISRSRVLRVQNQTIALITDNGLLCVMNFGAATSVFVPGVPNNAWRTVFNGDDPSFFPQYVGVGSIAVTQDGVKVEVGQFSSICFQGKEGVQKNRTFII